MITHKIDKGFDLRIAGAPERRIVDAPDPVVVAVRPQEFPGVVAPGIKPKLLVGEGDPVQTGEPLFFDKKDPDSHFVSPATGTVTKIVVGERRALLRVEVTPGPTDSFWEIPHVPLERVGVVPRETLVEALKRSGLWPLIRQRPVGRSADAERPPVAVFVNGMDTEPLAADPAFCVEGRGEDLQAGIDVLRALAGSPIYLTVRPGEQPREFQSLHGVEIHAFAGPHPAGLVGTHIARIRPLKARETAWFLKAQDAVRIGEWARTGRYPAMQVVALAGQSAANRRYYRIRQGASMTTLTGGKPADPSLRVISGTVLSGEAVGGDGFLGYFHSTVTIIPEGAGQRDLFGWLLPQTTKLSASRSVWSWIKPQEEYPVDARLHGGPRAIINLGLWEKVTPLDILPTYLVRAIQAQDLEEAIQLGLLEVTEEDVALWTFVDPCKNDVGAIVRRGLDLYELEG